VATAAVFLWPTLAVDNPFYSFGFLGQNRLSLGLLQQRSGVELNLLAAIVTDKQKTWPKAGLRSSSLQLTPEKRIYVYICVLDVSSINTAGQPKAAVIRV